MTLLFAATQGREVMDRVAAVIESDVITMRELERRAQPYLDQLSDITDASQLAKRRAETLHRVLDIEIGERLVSKEIEGNRTRLGVSDKDVDRAVQEVMRMNNLTRDQLQAALYGQGMTWKDYETRLREQLERARLMQLKVQGRVQIKEADVKRRCQQKSHSEVATVARVCAAHILIAIPKGADAAEIERRRIKANNLRAELLNGADFSAYALNYSDDKGTPDGSLGCFGRGEMVESFEKRLLPWPREKFPSPYAASLVFTSLRCRNAKRPTRTASIATMKISWASIATRIVLSSATVCSSS